MRAHRITVPELALIAGTRGMIGLGAGLLISERLRGEQRRAAGVALLVTGLLTTIPLALMLFRGRSTTRDTAQPARPRNIDESVRPSTSTAMMAD